jgi:putative transposase
MTSRCCKPSHKVFVPGSPSALRPRKPPSVDTACFSFTSIWSSSQNTDIGYFDGDAITRLRTIFSNVCNDFEAQLVEMDGEDNHVHLLVNYPPKHSISALVNGLKGVSSRLLRRERPDLTRRYWKGVLWSPSYFAASCGGAPIGILKAYIEQQKTPL